METKRYVATVVKMGWDGAVGNHSDIVEVMSVRRLSHSRDKLVVHTNKTNNECFGSHFETWTTPTVYNPACEH